VSPVAGDPYSEYGYDLNVDGTIVQHGQDLDDYGTTVYARAARTFVRTSAGRGEPFFAVLAVYAPHLPATPAPQDATRFPDARAPRTPSYNQRDVSASPPYIRDLPRFGSRTAAAIDSLYRERIRSLQAVDREVGRLVRTAQHAGVLDHTYVVFTSDNGFHLGQHRMPAGKYSPYETDIRVPLLMRGPGVPAGASVTALTGNVDLAPTFEAMAGVRRPSSNDGSSLLGLAKDPSSASRWRRNAYLVEHRKQVGSAKATRDPSLPLEPSDPEAPIPDPDGGAAPKASAQPSGEVIHRGMDARALRRTRGIPDYDAVRTTRWKYVEYADGQRELYDVRHDRDELVNLAGRGHVSVEATLHRRLERLRSCAGASCRGAITASTS
jgi:arylsulfatase A-like enzyme